MAARTITERSAGRGQAGQALVEFMLLLPAIVILVVVLLRTNSAIQVSINNQQYARAQALWLAFNSPVFPELRHRVRNFQTGSKMANQMVIGVSQNSFPNEGDQVYQPEATVQNVSRKPSGAGGSDEPQTEPDARAKVRVRTTVSLCTQANIIGGRPLLQIQPDPPYTATGAWSLKDDARIDYCRRPSS
jgi:hypothetical protein